MVHGPGVPPPGVQEGVPLGVGLGVAGHNPVIVNS